ncbi:MAG: hypothetical protein KBF37_02280 [Saprospiraceae bacterium]|jgi:hypothetical protein|nr:hypothetical protein [Saprospiraceae bacterium]MBP9209125.1 hypothetical protein [Saprospiraceae bacterium]MBV6473644.1 hypothetical protein [Saprospiraceae bacterium]
MENGLFPELVQKISRYFDREMNAQDEQEFLKEIEGHPAGHSAFIKEKAIREKLKAKVYRPAQPTYLASRIIGKIKKDSA